MARKLKEQTPPGQDKKEPPSPPPSPPPPVEKEMTMKEILDLVISHMRGDSLSEEQKQTVRKAIRKFSRIQEMIEKMDKVLDTNYEKQKPTNRKPKRHNRES